VAFLRRLHVNQIDALEAAMATIAAHVEALGPFAPAVELINPVDPRQQVPQHRSSSRRDGIDLSRLPSAAHLIPSGSHLSGAMTRAPPRFQFGGIGFAGIQRLNHSAAAFGKHRVQFDAGVPERLLYPPAANLDRRARHLV
jgi:hypothetical protein